MIKAVNNFFKKLIDFKFFCKEALYKIQKERKIFFRIVDINENFIELHVKGKSASAKKKVVDIIYENHIISGLSSCDACSLGVYYGFNLKNMCNDKIPIKYPLLCMNNSGRYRLLYEERDGNIAYMNTITNEKFVKSPICLAKDYNTIEQFDPTQACYIGILAGSKCHKLESSTKKTTYNSNIIPLFDKNSSLNSKKA